MKGLIKKIALPLIFVGASLFPIHAEPTNIQNNLTKLEETVKKENNSTELEETIKQDNKFYINPFVGANLYFEKGLRSTLGPMGNFGVKLRNEMEKENGYYFVDISTSISWANEQVDILESSYYNKLILLDSSFGGGYQFGKGDVRFFLSAGLVLDYINVKTNKRSSSSTPDYLKEGTESSFGLGIRGGLGARIETNNGKRPGYISIKLLGTYCETKNPNVNLSSIGLELGSGFRIGK